MDQQRVLHKIGLDAAAHKKVSNRINWIQQLSKKNGTQNRLRYPGSADNITQYRLRYG